LDLTIFGLSKWIGQYLQTCSSFPIVQIHGLAENKNRQKINISPGGPHEYTRTDQSQTTDMPRSLPGRQA
jgi:hypothetical protein